MSRMTTARALSYLACLLIALFIPPMCVRCSDNNIVSYSNMNKTLRDHIRKQRFLKHVLKQLRVDSPFKNSSSSLGPTQRGAFSSLIPEKGSSFNIPLSQNSYNSTSLNKAVPDKGMTSLASMSTPNLVFSEREEKNILTFKFRPRAVRNRSLVNKIHLWLYVQTKDKGKPTSSTSQTVSSSSPSPSTRDLNDEDAPNRRKGKRIKIRVFLSDASGARGQRIAELKTRVEGSTWGKLGLPVSLVSSLADAGANNTLRLRVECKRCSGKIQVVMPGLGDAKKCQPRQTGKNHKKKEERMRRWRKHCAEAEDVDERLFPFIVIEEKSKAVEGRFKRELASMRHVTRRHGVCSNQTTGEVKADHGVDGNLSGADHVKADHGIDGNLSGTDHVKADHGVDGNLSGADQRCRLVQTYVNFADLSLDHLIVYPPGFDYITCIQDCRDTSTSTENTLSRIADFVTQRIQYQEKTSQGSPQSSGRRNSSRHLYHHHEREHSPLQYHQPRVQQYMHHPEPRLHRWFGHKWNSLKMSRLARHAHRNNNVIVYLTGENKLTQIKLPHLVVRQCGCRNLFLTNKDQL